MPLRALSSISFPWKGLGSILFAITVDRPELNKGYQNTIHVGSCEELSVSNIDDMEPQPAIAGDGSPIIGQISLHSLFLFFVTCVFHMCFLCTCVYEASFMCVPMIVFVIQCNFSEG